MIFEFASWGPGGTPIFVCFSDVATLPSPRRYFIEGFLKDLSGLWIYAKKTLLFGIKFLSGLIEISFAYRFEISALLT